MRYVDIGPYNIHRANTSPTYEVHPSEKTTRRAYLALGFGIYLHQHV